MKGTETILYACVRAHTHACMHSQPCTNANSRKMLMLVIISEPPLSSLLQHSFRGHRHKKESVPSWLLLIGQAGSLLPGYQLTLTTQKIFSISLHSLNGYFFCYPLHCISLFPHLMIILFSIFLFLHFVM